jgi:hypothetical protein
MQKLVDLKGQTFERLTVIARAPNRGKSTQWVCQCVCGTICRVGAADLQKQSTRSCGCLNKERLHEHTWKHGMSKTPEFWIWQAMRKRCLKPTDPAFPQYGGRGITVCESWQHSFATFYKDMGPRPSPKHTLERRDNARGYEAANCCWATRHTQTRNTRRNRMITLHGETRCLADWCAYYAIHPVTVLNRLKRHWPMEQALTTPPRPMKQHASPSRTQ